MINIYYGKSGELRTNYLRKIQESRLKEGNLVISNLCLSRYMYTTNPNIVNKLRGSELYQLVNDKHPTSKLITTDAINTAELLICQGDVLILDKIEMLFTGQQICAICIALDDIKGDFKEIHIATNSTVPMDMFYNKSDVNFYICKGIDSIEKVDMEDLFDCEIFDFVRRI